MRVAGGKGDEADVVGGGAAAVAVLFEEGVEFGANFGAGAVAGVLGDEEAGWGAGDVEVEGVAFGRKAFLFELGANAEGGFELAAGFGAERGRRDGTGAGFVFAAVAGDGKVEGVERPVDDVFVDAEGAGLIGREAGKLGAEGPGAGADFGGGEGSGMMEGDVPGAAAAHGESTEEDAVGVDFVAGLDGGDGFKDIGFAGPVVGDAVPAAVDVELNLTFVGGVGSAGHDFLGAIEEGGFGESAFAAVEPDVEPNGFGAVVGVGYAEAVRLHGAVEGGDVAVEAAGFLGGPGGLAGEELAAALGALGEDAEEFGYVFGDEELFGMLLQHGAGFVEDGDVGEEGGIDLFLTELGEEGVDFLDRGIQLLFLGGS